MKKSKIDKNFLIIVAIIVAIVGLVFAFFTFDFSRAEPKVGLTYTKSYAEYLGLDWRETYLAILDDLQPAIIRLPIFWNEVEPQFKEYNFSDFDWQIEEAQKRGISVVVVLGRRTPRWPECHDPAWLSGLASWKVEQEQLILLRESVTHFQRFDNIYLWQVENEPFLELFGQCPPLSLVFLKKEIALVQSLDARPVLITDSGELSSWFKTGKLGDRFGHTLYRVVYNQYAGYSYYYLPPAYYWFKARLAGIDPTRIMISELQAEPWVPEGYTLQLDYKKMIEVMPLSKIQSNLVFAKKTGATEIYLWGVEWWYWLKSVKDDSSIWDAMKTEF